ncbi:hypothetical protein llap_1561 [Limosa lapponica baueri]|uniref:Uncharacterized protein n=1 Tax=Limosa lapponica baueri TaxID=1758121 RepID=A0A2I0UPW8_LIMLA|nr:hypothetical protein llap_1561 [Limosa lapponica baueri]
MSSEEIAAPVGAQLYNTFGNYLLKTKKQKVRNSYFHVLKKKRKKKEKKTKKKKKKKKKKEKKQVMMSSCFSVLQCFSVYVVTKM